MTHSEDHEAAIESEFPIRAIVEFRIGRSLHCGVVFAHLADGLFLIISLHKHDASFLPAEKLCRIIDTHRLTRSQLGDVTNLQNMLRT